MAEDLPKAVWSGTFTLFGITLNCAVLDNGQRIVEAESFHAFLRAMEENPSIVDTKELEAFQEWYRKGMQ